MFYFCYRAFIDSYVLGGRVGMLRSTCCVRNVILDLFPHAGGKGGSGWGGRGHVGRGCGCFTMDLNRFPMDLGGFLARGFALISLLSLLSTGVSGLVWRTCKPCCT